MKLGQAIDEMIGAKKVKRPGWAMYAFIEWANGKPARIMRAAEGEPPESGKPYLPGHGDLLAEDWMIA